MAVDYVARSRARTRRRETADVAALVRRLDWLLIGFVALLVAYGLWAVAGITRHDIAGDPNYYLVRQSVYAAVGAIGLVAAVVIDPERYRAWWRPLFLGTVGMIVLVILRGVESNGSKRWLDFGFFRFQPSEFGKVFFVLALAGFLAERAQKLGEARTTFRAVGLACVPIALVFLQPDVGTAMVYACLSRVRRGHTSPESPRPPCLSPWCCSGLPRPEVCTSSSRTRSTA